MVHFAAPYILLTLIATHQQVAIVEHDASESCLFDVVGASTTPLLCSFPTTESALRLVEFGLPWLLAGKNDTVVASVQQPGSRGMRRTGRVHDVVPWAAKTLFFLGGEEPWQHLTVGSLNSENELSYTGGVRPEMPLPYLHIVTPTGRSLVLTISPHMSAVYVFDRGTGAFDLRLLSSDTGEKAVHMLRVLPFIDEEPWPDSGAYRYTICQFGCSSLVGDVYLTDWAVSLLATMSKAVA
jgi:hypothetical protein